MHLQVGTHSIAAIKSQTIPVQRSFDELAQIIAQQRRHRKIHCQVSSLLPGTYCLIHIPFATTGVHTGVARARRRGIEPVGGPWPLRAMQLRQKCRRPNEQKQYPDLHASKWVCSSSGGILAPSVSLATVTYGASRTASQIKPRIDDAAGPDPLRRCAPAAR